MTSLERVAVAFALSDASFKYLIIPKASLHNGPRAHGV